VVNEAFANGVVLVGHEGDLELGSDAICGTDEDGVLPVLQMKAGAEGADVGHDGTGERFAGVGTDEFDSAIRFVDIHSGVFVLDRFFYGHGGLL